MGKSPEIVRKMQKSKPRIVSARNFQGNSTGIRSFKSPHGMQLNTPLDFEAWGTTAMN
jgi:hypothetical protein